MAGRARKTTAAATTLAADDDTEAPAVDADEAEPTPKKRASRKDDALASPLEPATSEDTPVPASTSRVAASAAAFSIAGDNHKRVIDEDGNTVAAEDMFDDGEGHESFVHTKQRLYEEFTQTNSQRLTTRLLFPAGARVPRGRADAIRKAVEEGPEGPEVEAPAAEEPTAPEETPAETPPETPPEE
jgi:hypothetical protein